MSETTLNDAQRRKLLDVPNHLRAMYREAVGGSRKAALRLHCLECVGWIPSEVEACTAPGCILYAYRLTGTHPETAAAARERAIAAGLSGPPRVGSTPGGTVLESPDGTPAPLGADPTPVEAVAP